MFGSACVHEGGKGKRREKKAKHIRQTDEQMSDMMTMTQKKTTSMLDVKSHVSDVMMTPVTKRAMVADNE